MSIYIEGINMPTHCIDCPFMVSRDNDDCILQSAEANENFENWEQMKAGCPLVHVSPHGDLIERDKLAISTAVSLDGSTYKYVHINNIKCAPVIIPASKEGK